MKLEESTKKNSNKPDSNDTPDFPLQDLDLPVAGSLPHGRAASV